MENDVPVFIFSWFSHVKADPIALGVPHLTKVKFQRFIRSFFVDEVRIFDEPQVKLLEASFNIDALESLVVPVIDEHEVRVDLPAAVLANNDSDIVALAGGGVDLRD